MAATVLVAAGCTAAGSGAGDRGSRGSSPGATSAGPAAPSPAPTTTDTGPVDVRATLEPLAIDDGPPPGGYLRDLFPTWKDVDGDGCDARRQALVAASSTPAQTGDRCKVIAGTWTSAYDGVTTTDPAEVQIDHVVPLADAWRSGADAWSAEQRVQFANDQLELWAVSAASNQAKGDRGPDEWRPPRPEIWCEYAQRWTAVKVRYGLTATTAERDALGQMLETCRP